MHPYRSNRGLRAVVHPDLAKDRVAIDLDCGLVERRPNSKSEADHDFSIQDARQDWTTNQSFKYPDKTQTTARGRAHVGGLSRWKIKNLRPGKEVIIAKRIDFVRGDIVTRMEIDGKAVHTTATAWIPSSSPWLTTRTAASWRRPAAMGPSVCGRQPIPINRWASCAAT